MTMHHVCCCGPDSEGLALVLQNTCELVLESGTRASGVQGLVRMGNRRGGQACTAGIACAHIDHWTTGMMGFSTVGLQVLVMRGAHSAREVSLGLCALTWMVGIQHDGQWSTACKALSLGGALAL